ncbi:MAG TPA: hypothetical protein VMV19_18190 [Xanthobacteraceae bacterium]|nr:hypothetical protein [Xanthobacteraceae bacterium]
MIDAEIHVQTCADNLAAAKQAAAAAHSAVVQGRKSFQRALATFQAAYPIATREATARASIAGEASIKRGLLNGTIDPASQPRIAAELAQAQARGRRGSSFIDRTSGLGGTASDFLRGQMRTGHRRGSLPASMRGRTVAPKVPSEV